MNKTLQKIIEGIYSLEGTEIDSVVEAVKLRRNQLHAKQAHSLKIGQRVSFKGRHGIIEKGVVEKVEYRRSIGSNA